MRHLGTGYRLALLIGSVGSSALLAGCSDSTKSTAQQVRQSVGPRGGKVEIEGATLTVPAGALARETSLLITRTDDEAPSGFVAASPVYRFEPAGLVFRVPASVEIRVTRELEGLGLIWTDIADEFAPLPSTRVSDRVVGEVEHFSRGFAGSLEAAVDGGAGGEGGSSSGVNAGDGGAGNAGGTMNEAGSGSGFGASSGSGAGASPGAGAEGGAVGSSGAGGAGQAGAGASQGGASAGQSGGGQSGGGQSGGGGLPACEAQGSSHLHAPGGGQDDVGPLDLVWTGSGYALLWSGKSLVSSDHGLFFTKLDSRGNTVGTEKKLLNTGSFYDPSLVWSGSGFGLTLRDSVNGIRLLRLDADGNALGSWVPVKAGDNTPVLVWTGTGYTLAWDEYASGTGTLYLARFDAQGRRLAADVPILPGTQLYFHVSLVWNGSGYAVAYAKSKNDVDTVEIVRLDQNGSVVGQPKIVGNGSISANPDLAWTGDGYGISWSDYASSSAGNQVYFARLDAAANVTRAATAIWTGAPYLGESAITWTGSGFGVSWHGDAGFANLARLDRSGMPSSPPRKLTALPTRAANPKIVWAENGYRLLWTELSTDYAGMALSALICP